MKNILSIGIASLAVTACGNPAFSPLGTEDVSSDAHVVYFNGNSVHVTSSERAELADVARTYQIYADTYDTIRIYVDGMSDVCHSTLRSYSASIGGRAEARERLSGSYSLSAAPSVEQLGLFFDAQELDEDTTESITRDVSLALERGQTVARLLTEYGIPADKISISYSLVAPESHADCGGAYTDPEARSTVVSGYYFRPGQRTGQKIRFD